MKQLKEQLRMWLAEKLLTWGMHIAPDNYEGETFVRNGLNYFEKALTKQVYNGE